MQPKALLLLYEPRCTYKHKKFYLRQGSNLLGTSKKACQIRLEDKDIPDIAANIRINNKLLTISRLSEKCSIDIQSNLYPSTRCSLDIGIDYILLAGKEFYLGEWRGLFEAMSAADLEQLKNVENKDDFIADFDKDTEKFESQDQQKTLIVQENLGPTQIIPDIPVPPIAINIGQNNEQMATLILPDIVDDNACTQQLDLIEQHGSDNMPATLEDNEENYIAISSRPATEDPKKTSFYAEDVSKMTRTLPIAHSAVQVQQQYIRKIQSQVPKKKLQDLWDIFDLPTEQQSSKNNTSSISNSLQNDNVLKRKPLVVSKVESEPAIQTNAVPLVKREFSNPNPKPERKIAFSGCQPTEMQKLIIDKMRLVIRSTDEDYDTLIVGEQVRITIRLLKALIQGKEILSQSYINNGSGRIICKVFGHIWDDIYKRSRQNIFAGDSIFVSNSLRDYQQLITMVGGTLVERLEKKLAKQTIKIVLSQKDKELYKDFGHYKNWRFYSERSLQQSIVLAQRLATDQINQDYFK